MQHERDPGHPNDSIVKFDKFTDKTSANEITIAIFASGKIVRSDYNPVTDMMRRKDTVPDLPTHFSFLHSGHVDKRVSYQSLPFGAVSGGTIELDVGTENSLKDTVKFTANYVNNDFANFRIDYIPRAEHSEYAAMDEEEKFAHFAGRDIAENKQHFISIYEFYGHEMFASENQMPQEMVTEAGGQVPMEKMVQDMIKQLAENSMSYFEAQRIMITAYRQVQYLWHDLNPSDPGYRDIIFAHVSGTLHDLFLVLEEKTPQTITPQDVKILVNDQIPRFLAHHYDVLEEAGGFTISLDHVEGSDASHLSFLTPEGQDMATGLLNSNDISFNDMLFALQDSGNLYQFSLTTTRSSTNIIFPKSVDFNQLHKIGGIPEAFGWEDVLALVDCRIEQL